MTGPDDAFLAPDDALRDFDEVTDVGVGTDGGERPGADDAARPNPAGAAVEDAGRSAGPPEGGAGEP
ncbi:hypothetical protein SAMN05660464_4001 [Geodermatophilus dictyosporus]|uniref:Uncharacterized protein n=1 Tax=Geodermatophilus dictyosporus TaxID=1523247 RepID=A0A1I5SIW4_9ACTN|nr:hypothetical protein [Geodermatophilus dictyosporus]SFP70591.1 hypothetical protein SAMN05660464_4001 [Geodermatophilus dictyosporus]